MGREVMEPTSPQAHDKAPCGLGGNVVCCSHRHVAPGGVNDGGVRVLVDLEDAREGELRQATTDSVENLHHQRRVLVAGQQVAVAGGLPTWGQGQTCEWFRWIRCTGGIGLAGDGEGRLTGDCTVSARARDPKPGACLQVSRVGRWDVVHDRTNVEETTRIQGPRPGAYVQASGLGRWGAGICDPIHGACIRARGVGRWDVARGMADAEEVAVHSPAPGTCVQASRAGM